MRTNIELDDALIEAAMRAGPYTTKREAVHAGLALLARRAAYRDLLALRGALAWSDADEEGAPRPGVAVVAAEPPAPPYRARPTNKARRERTR